MIKFFRRIRQQMIEKKRIYNYTLYALGEILLVTIGILIALQVNDWNENRKEHNRQNFLLKGLQHDITTDLGQLDKFKQLYSDRLDAFTQLDSSFRVPSELLFNNDKYGPKDMSDLFYRPPSLALSTGSYEAILNSGESIIYRNSELFSDIQEVQIKIKQHLESIYETIKASENQLIWKWNSEIRELNIATDSLPRELLYDLNYFYTHILLYRRILGNAEKYLIELKESLEIELSKNY